jgi:hypothetical protein
MQAVSQTEALMVSRATSGAGPGLAPGRPGLAAAWAVGPPATARASRDATGHPALAHEAPAAPASSPPAWPHLGLSRG